MPESFQEDQKQEISTDTTAGKAPIDPYQSFRNDNLAWWHERDIPAIEGAESARNDHQSSLENLRSYAEEFKQKAEALRVDIDAKKSGLISRVLHFRQIRDLEAELGVTEHQMARTEELAKDKEELLAAYDRLIAEESELEALMEEALKENEAWDEARRLEVLEEEKKRDVSELSREYGTFFVHDIVTASWKPSENNRAVDTKQMDWGDQFDLLLGLEPTISASTLDHAHEGEQRTFGQNSWGAFLSGGRVLGGSTSDAGTRAYGLRERSVDENNADTDAIAHAITKRGESYNELVIEKPEVAGVYCKWDDDIPLVGEVSLQNTKTTGYDGWWKNMRRVLDRNIPVFVLTPDGRTKLLYDIDPDARTFMVAEEEIKPEHMVDLPGIYKQHLGEGERKKAVMRVFDKVSGLLSEEDREKYKPDGTGSQVSASPYRIS